MKRINVVLLAAMLVAAVLAVTAPASAQTCEGYTYETSSLGAIRPDSARDLATIEGYYSRQFGE